MLATAWALVVDLFRLPFLPILWWVRRRSVPRGAFVRLVVRPRIVEIAPPRPWLLSLFPQLRRALPTELVDLRRLADHIVRDDRVEGLVVEIPPLMAGWATCAALRTILERVRVAGKRVVAHLPHGGSHRELFVASAAGEVMISPQASIAMTGLSAESRYLKEGLAKIGLSLEAFRRAEFKTAMEPLTEEGMSEAQREQIEAILEGIDRRMVEGIAEGRRMTPEGVRRCFEEVFFLGEEAVEAGLVDRTCPEDLLKRAVAPEAEKLPPFVGAGRYLSLLDTPLLRPLRKVPYVAVVKVGGAIPDPTVQGGEPPAAARALRKVGRDRRALGVVLYVDSPGGSALASDLIHREVVRLREKKPVVALMGDVAASGGYYVSAGCDAIVADDLTLTGSIGVIAARVTARDLLGKMGIRTEVLRKAPHADMLSPAREASDAERRILDRMVGGSYEAFLAVVAEGRGKSREEIDAVARGRVWIGADAHSLGLIDDLGAMDAAIDRITSRIELRAGVRRRLRPRLVGPPRQLVPPPDPPAKSAALFALAPELVELARLCSTEGRVLFYAAGLPRIR